MTLVPFTTCCLLLGIDPKTLRLWLTSARLSCLLHPTDGRLKCLTPSQLQQLAELHGRFLPEPLPGEVLPTPSSPVLTSPRSQAVPPLETACPCSRPPEIEWRQQMTLLQAQVTTLQQQISELALALLRERSTPNSILTPPACAPVPLLRPPLRPTATSTTLVLVRFLSLSMEVMGATSSLLLPKASFPSSLILPRGLSGSLL